MITDAANDQDLNNITPSEEEQTRQEVDALCMKYELNSPNIYTYLGHFTNFVYNLMIDIISSERIILPKTNEVLDPRQLKGEYLFCLLKGKAILRRMTLEADGKETCFSKYTLAEGSSLIGLYNYKTHNPNQFYTLQCQNNCKLLQMAIPQPLTQMAYKRNTNKLAFISQFFIGREGSYRTLTGAVLELFKQKTYTRTTQLYKQGSSIQKIILIRDGLCEYFKNIKVNSNAVYPVKMVGLFKRGTHAMLGVEKMHVQLVEDPNERSGNCAKFSINVESSYLQVYQIAIEDLIKIPQGFLQRFTEKCQYQLECLLKASDKFIKKQNEQFQKEIFKSIQQKQATHSNVALKQSPMLRKVEFDEKIINMMGNKVKEDRQSHLQKKIALNLNELTRAQSSAERVRDFKNLLSTKVTQKQQLLKEGHQAVQEQFQSNFLTIFEPDEDIQKQLMAKTQIINHTNILEQKKRASMKHHQKDSTPLFMLQDSSRVDSKSFKLKMLRRGFMKDHYQNYLKDIGMSQNRPQTTSTQSLSIQKKVEMIKKRTTKKIDITNRIKQQCMVIRSGFDQEEAVLQVIKGYQSMKQLQFKTMHKSKRSSISQTINQQTDYGLLLNIIRSSQKKKQSLESVHQKIRFLKKRTLTPYSHQKHLKQSARLQRYSVSSLRHTRKSLNNDI